MPMNSTALSPHVFDATAASFEQDVILKSKEVPVLVDFWATWCGPCKSLGPILEKLADDYGGGFLLAKVDVDQEQELASYFQIRSVPTVMLLKDAEVLGGFPGALPEGQIRQFLEQHGVTPAEGGGAAEANAAPAPAARDVESLRAAVAAEPDNGQTRLDLALALLDAGEFAEAGTLIEGLPAELRSEAPAARALSRVRFEQAAADAPDRASLEQRVAESGDADARYRLGARLILDGEAEAGFEHLLELLRGDKDPDGLPRRALLDAFNLVEDEALTRAFRRRMTALLY